MVTRGLTKRSSGITLLFHSARVLAAVAELGSLGGFARMKILFKALLWSTGFEILLLAAVFVAHHVHLGVLEFVFGVLCYLALYCHAPAVWLLRHFPAAQENLVLVALVQWFLWFLAFGVVFALSRIFHKLRLEHEAHAA